MNTPLASIESLFASGRVETRMSSATVALYNEMGLVLVVKANYKDYWSLPGGIVDSGETPRLAAVREVYEETRILLDADKLEFCMIIDRVSSIAHTYQLIFEQQAETDTFNNIRLDPIEIESYALVTRESIIAGEQHYSDSTVAWAKGVTGYVEQHFKLGPK